LPAVTDYRYPRKALTGDFARAGVGLVITAGPALAIPATSMTQLILVPLALLFLVFGIRTWLRSVAVIAVTARGISLSAPWQARLAWHNLKAVRLNYYSTRFDRSGGWMQLMLKGQGGPDGATIRVDSTLDGFSEVARHVAAIAQSQRIPLSESTRNNFGALGISVDD
jgi:hypothetical protein